MNRRTRLGLSILEAAVLLGVLGDALLRATPWGINVLLWTGALAAAALALTPRSERASLTGASRLLLAAALFFAAAFAWRDSLTLKLLDAGALIIALSLMAWGARGGRVRLGGLTDYVMGMTLAGLNAAFGSFPLLLSDVKWREIPRAGWMRHALAIARGLVIAVPLLLVFGALFMAADAIFEGIVRQRFNLDAGTILAHVALTIFFAWVTGGFLRGMLLGGELRFGADRRPAFSAPGFPHDSAPPAKEENRPSGVSGETTARPSVTEQTDASAPPPHYVVSVVSVTEESVAPAGVGGASSQSVAAPPNEPHGATASAESSAAAAGTIFASYAGTSAASARKEDSAPAAAAKGFSFGIVEVGIALGLLDLLFFSFVMVQLRYFFGGAALVEATTGLTYAEYARRGFFELVGVAALALPLLLAAHWITQRKGNPAHERIFRVLAGAMLALLVVIMVSALARMRLYQSEYGLTELRLYTTAFMGWLAAVFVWFALTVLRGQRKRFACGALVAGFLILGALHVINPDALIVRTNAAHARQSGRAFDAGYVSWLSADAVPALLEELPALSPEQRCVVAANVLTRWSPANARADWRSWSWSRAAARRVTQEHATALSDLPCPAQANGPAEY